MSVGGEADSWWTDSGLCFVPCDVGFATVQLMTGFHPATTESPGRLKTSCTRWGRRDHLCNNDLFLPKNDVLAGVLGAGLMSPAKNSSTEDWPESCPTHSSTRHDPTAAAKCLQIHLSCWEQGFCPLPMMNRGVVEVHGTGSNCRDELSDLQQGGGKIRVLRQCVELSWNHTGLSASNHVSKLPFLSIYHYTTSYHPGILLNSGATMIFP